MTAPHPPTPAMREAETQAVTFSAGLWQYFREYRYEFDLDRLMTEHDGGDYDYEPHPAVDALFEAYAENLASIEFTFVIPVVLADVLIGIKESDEADERQRKYGPW